MCQMPKESTKKGLVNLNSTVPGAERDDVKQLCIKMYLNGMGLRGIDRVTDIHHTTVMHWIRSCRVVVACAYRTFRYTEAPFEVVGEINGLKQYS